MELELSMTKLRAEEASLRDALSKLSALNESLAQDKLGLNRLVAQVCCAQQAHLSPSLRPHTCACLSWSLPLFWPCLCLSICLLVYISSIFPLSGSMHLAGWVCGKTGETSLVLGVPLLIPLAHLYPAAGGGKGSLAGEAAAGRA